MQPFQPQDGQQVQMGDQNQFMEILSTIQKSLEVRESSSQIPANMEQVEKLNISESLGQIPNVDQETGVINTVDRQSSDVINLVTMLYGAIWNDESVPIPIKELIGRTQVTIIKVALSDNEFFNCENNPARAILSEFSAAGIGWTEVEKLEEDPLYKKMQQQVNQILLEYDYDITFFENLIDDFRSFRIKEAAKTRKLNRASLRPMNGRIVFKIYTNSSAKKLMSESWVESLIHSCQIFYRISSIALWLCWRSRE